MWSHNMHQKSFASLASAQVCASTALMTRCSERTYGLWSLPREGRARQAPAPPPPRGARAVAHARARPPCPERQRHTRCKVLEAGRETRCKVLEPERETQCKVLEAERQRWCKVLEAGRKGVLSAHSLPSLSRRLPAIFFMSSP